MTKRGYTKQITNKNSGMVLAEVFCDDGRDVGSKWFDQLISTNKSIRRSCIKAHKWADKRINLCEEQESIVVTKE